ncbi:hypothetical protein OC846_002872 [Tilletia horrida]|uniref:Protein SET n=1 Tax=Tilletia horrida TaxID=155126 RepID=A0AAN6JUG4_9BASI|nr:hypothetical protein OC845_002067 [Tilletia horrida]KAK0552468.1 hypothetical protein OC846_002872 [Tilletia horrida]KAK0570162.1 hypothetical protein OC861_000111 [Tilletia horrida]
MSKIILQGEGAINPDVQTKLDALEQKFDNANAELIRQAAKIHEPLFAERAEIIKAIPGFWHQALVNCPPTSIYIDDDDHELLSHITDIKVHRDSSDPRAATIEFFFSPNDYISDASLKKEYKLIADAPALGDKFEFSEHTQPQATSISWKSDEKNLCKLKPTRVLDAEGVAQNGKPLAEEDIDEFDPGSFFSSLFENTNKALAGALGEAIVDEFFQNAIGFYTNSVAQDFGFEDFDDEEDDEEDDDDAAEIDLEDDEPAKKKPKNA